MRMFKKNPRIVYRWDRNLKDILVRSRLLPIPTPVSVGTKKCSRPRCKTCPFVIQTPSISFPKGSFQIKETFTCESRNLIYAIICKRCEMKYIGETGRLLAERFRDHLRYIHKKELKPVPLHFNSPNHRGADDISVTAIKSCTGDQALRFSLENRLIHGLGVLSPAGLNVQHAFVWLSSLSSILYYLFFILCIYIFFIFIIIMIILILYFTTTILGSIIITIPFEPLFYFVPLQPSCFPIF